MHKLGTEDTAASDARCLTLARLGASDWSISGKQFFSMLFVKWPTGLHVVNSVFYLPLGSFTSISHGKLSTS